MENKLKRPVLRYHGGKWILAPWIIARFPEHKVYVELFGGGGSVLLRKPRSYAEVYNDTWETVVNVFRVLRDPRKAEELERLIRLTPFSRSEYLLASDKNTLASASDVELARLTIFRSFAGFGSGAVRADYCTSFRANSSRSGSTPAKDWARYPDHISTFTERLAGVVIENRSYEKIVAQQDSADTLFYVDPPYVRNTRTANGAVYAHEMADADHIKMIDLLKSVKGMVVLSGYQNSLYEEHLKGWVSHSKETYADRASRRTETLWLNQNAVDALLKDY